eukprot:g16480.t1
MKMTAFLFLLAAMVMNTPTVGATTILLPEEYVAFWKDTKQRLSSAPTCKRDAVAGKMACAAKALTSLPGGGGGISSPFLAAAGGQASSGSVGQSGLVPAEVPHDDPRGHLRSVPDAGGDDGDHDEHERKEEDMLLLKAMRKCTVHQGTNNSFLRNFDPEAAWLFQPVQRRAAERRSHWERVFKEQKKIAVARFVRELHDLFLHATERDGLLDIFSVDLEYDLGESERFDYLRWADFDYQLPGADPAMRRSAQELSLKQGSSSQGSSGDLAKNLPRMQLFSLLDHELHAAIVAIVRLEAGDLVHVSADHRFSGESPRFLELHANPQWQREEGESGADRDSRVGAENGLGGLGRCCSNGRVFQARPRTVTLRHAVAAEEEEKMQLKKMQAGEKNEEATSS